MYFELSQNEKSLFYIAFIINEKLMMVLKELGQPSRPFSISSLTDDLDLQK
jgi:hypothetical protein